MWVELKVKTQIILDSWRLCCCERKKRQFDSAKFCCESWTDFGSRIFFIQASISAMQALENLFFNASWILSRLLETLEFKDEEAFDFDFDLERCDDKYLCHRQILSCQQSTWKWWLTQWAKVPKKSHFHAKNGQNPRFDQNYGNNAIY